MAVIRSIQQLESLADEWNRLADLTGHALLRHEWFLTAARTLHANEPLTIVTDRDASGRLTAVAPLVVRTERGMSRLEIMGSAALHEPTGFLCADAARREGLLDAVCELRRPLLLRRVVIDTLPSVVEGQSTRRNGLVMSRPGSPCVGIDFDGGGASFLDGVPGKLRYDIRRARRRAAALGPVAFEALAPGPAELEPLMAEFTTVEAAGWKGQKGSALAANPRLGAFFHSYATRTADAGTLRLFRLRIGNRTAAVQMAVEVYGKLWVLKIGYDETFARCSPGLLLTAEAIQHAFERGLKSYEFLGGVEDWEKRWNPRLREHRFVLFYPWTVAGCVGVSLDVVGAGWRRVRRAAGAQA
jgi:CelD/BcsL family acetyltransferase involved in cellulose biosynthesis